MDFSVLFTTGGSLQFSSFERNQVCLVTSTHLKRNPSLTAHWRLTGKYTLVPSVQIVVETPCAELQCSAFGL